MDVEADAADLRRIVEVEAAIAEVRVSPLSGIVDRADELPVGMRTDAKSADISLRRAAEPVCRNHSDRRPAMSGMRPAVGNPSSSVTPYLWLFGVYATTETDLVQARTPGRKRPGTP